MNHFVYQRVHTLAGKALHLEAHLDLLARAFQHIYGGEKPSFDAKTVFRKMATQLKAAKYPTKGSATMLLRLAPDDEGGYVLSIEPERGLLDNGYALSSLRPGAITYEYRIPFGGFPTGFQLSAAEFFDSLALMHHGATRSVRREGDKLLSCGDAPLFGIRGRTLFTAPLIDGVMESIERRLVIAAAPKAHLDFLEEAPRHSELGDFDELFFADAAGITSISDCDGAKFMSILASRLVAGLPIG